MSTESHRSPLARHRITVRPGGITAQIAERRRLVAFAELFNDAPRKPDALYDLTRSQPRCQLPDEKQHRMIHEGIRDGYISRQRIIRYRAQQLLDDLNAFTSPCPANDRLLAVMMREVGEAVEAHVVAEGTPSAEQCASAVREGREAVAVIELRNAALEREIAR